MNLNSQNSCKSSPDETPAGLTRRQLLRRIRRLAAGSSALAAGSGAYSIGVETRWLSVERTRIPIRNLPPGADGFKIVQLSDFHLYPYTTIGLIQRTVQQANAIEPDLIVLTGDYVTTQADAIDELAPVLALLNARQGVFGILGNHDVVTNASVVQRGFQKAGLPLLQNRSVTIGGHTPCFTLAGLDDGWMGHPDLNAALSPAPPALPTILLMHEPDFADTFAQDGRIALQLSGHSHGGQARIPGLGALHLPRYGRKYDQGLYRVQNMWVYTSRGIGVIGLPLRFNCRPEITEITLVRA